MSRGKPTVPDGKMKAFEYNLYKLEFHFAVFLCLTYHVHLLQLFSMVEGQRV